MGRSTQEMSDGERALERELVGLCCDCQFQRVITSNKGSRFYLCTLSEKEPAFPKYPRLPVLQCAGFRARRPVDAEHT